MTDDLFSKIEDKQQIDRIFEEITKASAEISIQLQDNSSLQIKSYKKFGSEIIVFRELNEQPPEQEVIVSFNLSPEKYFLKSKLVQKNKACHIEITEFLYKLQRRKNFRLPLPKLWEPKFECLLPISKYFDVYDLSSGGFSIEYTPSELSAIPDTKVEGVLRIKNRLDLHLSALLKHSKEVGSKAYPRIRAGLEIVGLKQKDENQIMSILMEIHREIFSKLK